MQDASEHTRIDTIMQSLADIQRRKILFELMNQDSQDPIQLPADGFDTEETVANYLTIMRHNHLPKLAENGFIQWDEQSYEVRKGPEFAEIRPVLKLLDEHADELPNDVV